MEAVRLESVSFAYPKSEYNALENVSFSLEKGSFSLVMGESGAGKSTLLSLLKKEIAPVGRLSGKIEVSSFAGYICQNAEESIVCDRLRSELAFGVENQGKSVEEIDLLIAETAAYFNLESKLNSAVSELSGGEKQLVCLASVMMMKPEVLILDEPCAMLDPVSAERFATMIKKLHRDFNITVIMSEHSTDLLYSYADNILFFESGTLLSLCSPLETLEYLEKNNKKMALSVPLSLRLKDKNITFKPLPEKSESPKSALSAKHLRFAYVKGRDVLSNLNLELYSGKINAVIGCNGCGKTTLLKVLSGVKKSYSGKVKASGKTAMLTQNVKDVFTKETCGEEVRFGEITDFLELSGLEGRHPYDLSGGQAQRLALAKVLERNADIILLDEPTRGLDSVLKLKLGELLKRLCKSGKTVLVVSHDLDFVGDFADYVSFMSEGRIAVTDEKRRFFASLSFYTTSASRLTGGSAASTEDIIYE